MKTEVRDKVWVHVPFDRSRCDGDNKDSSEGNESGRELHFFKWKLVAGKCQV